MAGSYPDMPANRLAYHNDGTIGWVTENDADNIGTGYNNNMLPEQIRELSVSQMENLNDDDDSTPGEVWRHQPESQNNPVTGRPWPAGWSIAMVFPEHRDLYGIFPWFEGPSWLNELQWSSDTTNGVDGTWNTIIAGPDRTYGGAFNLFGGSMFYRQLVIGFSGAQARGVRVGLFLPFAGIFNTGTESYWSMFHLFGQINDDLVTERLVWIDESTGLEFDNLVDWGDVPRGTTLTKEIRLKNLSPTYAATNVELLFDTVNPVDNTSWYSIKDYGGGYTNTFTITSISAGATYPAAGPMTVKLELPAGAQLSMDTAWLQAGPPTWV